MTITIDYPSVNLKGFITRYRAWHQAQLIKNPHRSPVIDLEDHGLRIQCFSDRDVDKINACQDHVVIIDSLNEGLHYQQIFDQYDKNKHYILFIPKFDQTIIELPINFTPVHYSHLLFDIVEDYVDPKSWYYYLNRQYEFDYPKSCLLTTIAGHRGEREPIKNHLVSVLDPGSFVFRYDNQDFGKSIDQIDIVDTTVADFVNCHSTFEKRFQYISKEPGYVYWKFVSTAAHNLSYFNLVLESEATKPVFFLTEKTVKPLLIGQPFVIYACQGFLQHLKTLGFRTFGELWDESYDQMQHWRVRAKAVAELCVKLGDFDWLANQDQLQEICQYNQKHINNLTWLATQEFHSFETTIESIAVEINKNVR